ncbi:ATP-binding protein [Acidiferrobacter sp.]|uniref:ATP-binding protein n=1 Tax=Acidiferrobacter sp. TaxID=1872107 RepID=UPI00260F97F2|nr:ATP-binding protein [Acidiferrobacter sp.]
MVKQGSLRWWIGGSFALIVAVSLAEMVMSLAITELARGEARAVNIAGTVRMQTYRLVAVLEGRPPGRRAVVRQDVQALSATLRDTRLTASVRRSIGPVPARRYAALAHAWNTTLKPRLLAYGLGRGARPARPWLTREAAAFVGRANAVVVALQNDSRRKILWLQTSEVAGILVILAALAAVAIAMRRAILAPVADLVTAAARMTEGDFSFRVAATGDNEWARLGRAMNRMAESLAQSYATMERRITARTRDLARTNRSLALLYDVSRRLADAPCEIATYRHVLRATEDALGARDAVLCLTREDPEAAAVLASDVYDSRLLLCRHNTCRDCLNGGRTRVWDASPPMGSQGQVLSVPIMMAEAGAQGALSLRLPSGVKWEAWQLRTVETVAHHIGAALGAMRRAAQERRLALLEERHAMARDLHDSLAQALSYLKIQVARLRARDVEGADPVLPSIVGDIDEGLAAAYRQLRELLATFRLQIPDHGLEGAFSATAEEFSRRAGIPVRLVDHLSHALLSANEEIDMLHITREALANIEHHAKARRIWVRLSLRRGRFAVVRIEDDGIGIADPDVATGHYGLAIMRERARNIHGRLRIERRRQGGTRVVLTFVPVAYRGRLSQTPKEARAEALP